jgi:hypothetical protein
MMVKTIHSQNVQGINSSNVTAKRLIEGIQNYFHCMQPSPILLEERFLELNNPHLQKHSRMSF